MDPQCLDHPNPPPMEKQKWWGQDSRRSTQRITAVPGSRPATGGNHPQHRPPPRPHGQSPPRTRNGLPNPWEGRSVKAPPCVTFHLLFWLLFLYGALDSHPFFPSHVASGRCFLLAAAAGALAGVVSAFAKPSSWCVGAVLNVAWCAVCASVAPNSWRIEDVLVVAGVVWIVGTKSPPRTSPPYLPPYPPRTPPPYSPQYFPPVPPPPCIPPVTVPRLASLDARASHRTPA